MPLLGPPPPIDYESAERRRHPAILREARSSRLLGPVRTDQLYLDALRISAAHSRYLELEQVYLFLRDQLAALRTLRARWDSYHAQPPNEAAIQAADSALFVLRARNAEPSAVLPSAEGGVGICFVKADRYAHLEFANDGDVWILIYGSVGSPETWQLQSADSNAINEGWTRIRAHLQP